VACVSKKCTSLRESAHETRECTGARVSKCMSSGVRVYRFLFHRSSLCREEIFVGLPCDGLQIHFAQLIPPVKHLFIHARLVLHVLPAAQHTFSCNTLLADYEAAFKPSYEAGFYLMRQSSIDHETKFNRFVSL